ncbi:hypothetical protein [Marinicellulosiphila megalodicopiae]|uniref:hypothetical protein n=1 Tax=Marinicellulosiphila megalodicopiae TaxID=2724896 RepID=UPI003BB1235C
MKKLGVRLPLMVIISLCSTLAMSKAVEKSGRWFGYWGWNAGQYTKSDIHFTGDNYDFTLNDVIANDRQSPFSFYNYFQPNRITIPQTNFKIGYFFDEHYSVSVGVDHMKYVMDAGQTVKINGNITNSGTVYDGIYDNQDIVLDPEFLKYEHTDGLNYLNSEHNYSNQWFTKSITEKMNVTTHWLVGMGGGVLMPKTNVTLLNNPRHDDFHFSGLGVNVKAGLNVFVGQHFFVQSELKTGYINMWDIRTTIDESDKASQQFMFMQANILLGWMI